MSSSGHENEIKLAVPDVDTARKLLHEVGFRVSRRRVFESNTVLDTDDGLLRKHGELLRLRRAGKTSLVTYKGPPIPGPHKNREELETTLQECPTMETIFDRLGYRPVFTYEKFRTEYRQPGRSGVATVDQTPIGTYIELEGPATWIDRTARKLGFSARDYILDSYGRLYLRWVERQGIPPSNMVFSGRRSRH